mgnify:CR=1 FL=1
MKSSEQKKLSVDGIKRDIAASKTERRDQAIVDITLPLLKAEMLGCFEGIRPVLDTLINATDPRNPNRMIDIKLDLYTAEKIYKYGAEGINNYFVTDDGDVSPHDFYAYIYEIHADAQAYNFLFNAFVEFAVAAESSRLYEIAYQMYNARLLIDLFRLTSIDSIMSPFEVALLARMKPASVRNACQKDLESHKDADGNICIKASNAHKWLKLRRRYVESILVPEGEQREAFIEHAQEAVPAYEEPFL